MKYDFTRNSEIFQAKSGFSRFWLLTLYLLARQITCGILKQRKEFWVWRGAAKIMRQKQFIPTLI
jgi:hypothetical protein